MKNYITELGFDQTTDFIIPSEFNPRIIIEARITEDDGTSSQRRMVSLTEGYAKSLS